MMHQTLRHPSGRSPRQTMGAQSGMTLVELLLVVIIMSIITGLAIPRLNLEGYKVSSAVRGVTASLSYAQRLAVSLQHDIRVSFDAPNRRIRVHEDANNNGVMDINERITYTNLEDGVTFGRGGAPAITYTDGVSGPLTFNFTRTQGGLPLVVFRRDGTVSESGGFYLNTIKSIAQGTTSSVRAGEMIRSSGRVIWYSYATTSWIRGN
ncbi:MAG: prepilin-type N-terminal cleavage/methylation domain-containing protein [Gemmatimonadota bacterium]|nr:prepilin-type N-terminal cleavage/methylation domain-containing protein [Gemmatimonadota bacterium]